MAKERLNAIDVAVSVANLKKLLNNLTLVNIYDITNRVFILKFSKNENKIYVLIEIGCRIHATQFLRSVDHLPSNFNAKDRIIDFTFSSEEYAHHLVVQLFLPGNIYLTDHEYKVLTVLRPQNTGDKFFKVGTNYIFDMDYNSWYEPVKKTMVEELLSSKKLVDLFKEIFPSVNNSFVLSTLNMMLKSKSKSRSEGKSENNQEQELTDSKKLDRLYSMEELDEVYHYVEYVRLHLVELLNSKDKIPGYVYKNAKGDMEDFGVFEQPNSAYFEDFNDALDAFFTKNELLKQEKKTVDKKPTKLNKIKLDQDKREAKLMEEISKLDREIRILEENIDISDNCLNLTKALIASGASWNDIYEQLQVQRKQNHPLMKYIKEVNIPNQTLTFVNYVDNEYHDQLDNNNSSRENGDKLDHDNDDSNKKNKNKSKKEQKRENRENRNKENENVVVLDYSLNSQQNLKNLYNTRKKLENKLERTRVGKEYALKKVTKRLSKQKEEKKVNRRGRDVRISSLRKRFWFEKFYWFITSQGYLVLAGRDALQNELLVKRYLTNGDLYFHADVHGASSVILKMKYSDMTTNENEEEDDYYMKDDMKDNEDNNNNRQENQKEDKNKSKEKEKESKLVFKEGKENEELVNRIKVSIEEAGSFAVCHSNAWNDRFLVQSWWVYWYQVSKTPPTGEYVPQGSFVIRGKKNYLQPQKLEMGITYLFQVHPFQSLDNPEEDKDFNDNNNNNTGVSNSSSTDKTSTTTKNTNKENDTEKNDDTQNSEQKEQENKRVSVGFKDEVEEVGETEEGEGEEYEVKDDDDDSDVEEEQEDEDEEDFDQSETEEDLLSEDMESEGENDSDEDYLDDEQYDFVNDVDSDEDNYNEEEDESSEYNENKDNKSDRVKENNQDDDLDNDDKVVRMGNVEMIGEYEANIQKRTKGRRATAHPLKFQLEKLKNQLQKLNLTGTSSNRSSKSSTKELDYDDNDNRYEGSDSMEYQDNQKNKDKDKNDKKDKNKSKESKRVSVGFKDEVEEVDEEEKEGRSVRIVEPEKLVHSEEAVRKIRQRKLTCLNPNLSKLGNLLKGDSKDRESVDEEQEEDKNDRNNRDNGNSNSSSTDKTSTTTQNIEDKLKESNKNNTKDKYNEEEKEFYRDIEVKKMEHEKEEYNRNSRETKKEQKRESRENRNKENNKDEDYLGNKNKKSNRVMRFINQKVNKIKKKYGQDDEETQELRRMLTGSKKMQNKKYNSKAALLSPVSITINNPRERFNKEKDKEKEIKTLNDRELENYMNQLSCLSRQLKEDDDVLSVIPMCAPYTAIKHYKNAIKLVPGNAKKGTIATHSLQHFIKNDPDNAHYLKLITTDQLTLTLIGNCKFTNTKG